CDNNNDGISGRISVSSALTGGQALAGRFTSKGGRASVRDQIAYALNRDMGVASATMPVLDGDTSPSAAEVTQQELDRMTRYVALLGVGARRNLIDVAALRGEQLFVSAGCAACHVPQLTTGNRHPFAELRNQTIRPFTDLLLHDMGPGLADPMRDGNTSASEWRTSPLWNIGFTADVSGGEAYLHDGRARTLEEAVLWHDGEGHAAREAFRTMPAADRVAVVTFLRSL
ncbi:MAG: di-heme oxidoredictase family protein, partial [Planctomycetota bacterium]